MAPLRVVLVCLLTLGVLTDVCIAATRRVLVSTDGSAQFKTVQEAIDSITDATEENPVEVFIKSGEYDGMVKTKDWVNLVGEERDKTILVYSRKPQERNVDTHVIWATSNSAIRNLTLIGKDVKYCIHTDGAGKWVLKVENCIFRRDLPPNYKGNRTAFGIGLRGDQHIVMKDCALEAETPIYFHNWNRQPASCSMTVEKCRITGKKNGIILNTLGSGQRDFFVLHDSEVKADVTLAYTKGTHPKRIGGDEMEVYGSGNTLTGTTDKEIIDDAANRMSGYELAVNPGAREKPAPKPAP